MSTPILPNLLPDFDCDTCGESFNPSDCAQCSNCDNCDDCCNCKECPDCGTLNDETSRCGDCDNCDSCCLCWTCGDCGDHKRDEDNKCPNCDACDDCCNCWTCEHCDRKHDDGDYQCSNCNRCDRCCDCYSCDHCGDRHDSDNHCGDCDRCNSCCNCSESSNSEVLRDGHFQFHTSKTFKVNRSRRHLSLEMEIAGIDNDCAYAVTDAASNWSDPIVEDGSLPDSGFEINTNPTNGDLFLRHIGELCDGLADADARIERCCGMHCHLDARDYSYYDLFKLTRLYAHVEDGLFALCSRSRRSSHYSRPCASSLYFAEYKTFKKDLMERLYNDDCKPRKQWDGKVKPSTTYSRPRKRQTLSCFNEKYSGTRYNALNLHSFFYRRTIEFRHHQGTANATKATSWAMVCAAVLDSASRMTEKQIAALPYDSFEALLAVTPHSLHTWMLERKDTLHA